MISETIDRSIGGGGQFRGPDPIPMVKLIQVLPVVLDCPAGSSCRGQLHEPPPLEGTLLPGHSQLAFFDMDAQGVPSSFKAV